MQPNTPQRALIFVNGDQIDLQAVRALIQPSDLLIAADGGLRHLMALGLQPALLIGDLDSTSPEQVAALQARGVRVERYPVHKDETDLELAVNAALQRGVNALLILGAIGGRLDMTLANIFLLALPELRNIDARLEDGVEEVFLIRPDAEGKTIQGQPGDRVSLLPFGEPAGGIRTSGLSYPLRGEMLYPERTRGVSNELVEPSATVSLETGILICIHTRQPSAAGVKEGNV